MCLFYILRALNMKTGLNQLTMSSVTYFISQANAGIQFSQHYATEKYREDLEKMKVNGPGSGN